MSTSTRLLATLAFGVFLAAVTLYSVSKEMETVAATSIAGIMTILSTYLWSQTKRPHYEVTYQESDDPVVHSRNRSNDYDVQMDG